MIVRFYGSLADRIGRCMEVDPPPGGSTVGALRRELASRFPEAGGDLLRPGVRVCLDEMVAEEDQPVGAAREAAFLPPLSGG